MKRGKLLVIISCMLMVLLLCQGKVQAVVQASGKAGVTKNLDEWLQQTREMEKAGGALGLQENFESDFTASGKTNNLDCHMQKNTEYGAMAILSASSYGNPNKINNGETTTGNKSGIYMYINKEFVAAGGPIKDSNIYKSINGKYKNIYFESDTTYAPKGSEKYKKGDALKETEGWHGTISSGYDDVNTWGSMHTGGNAMVRAYKYSIFSWHSSSGGGAYAGWYDKNYGRAVVVVGEGL